ncbi:MAG: hypothetical protein ABFC67_10115 [Mizugakiibacter sp.]|uniref:HvfA family oxazolone/thioamide-modified RiPP metallophore n=1 Tax=Mizugakiibacter sp. TaxID=1972610 RepID=UPI0031C75D4F|nr:hypothetical protein [Xanthomonadaceae bacterium]
MSKSFVKPLSIALGAALVGGLSMQATAASAFQLGSLGSGYMLAQATGSQEPAKEAAPNPAPKAGDKTMKHEEGKCGEGKCGARRKAHEGHCGGDKVSSDKAGGKAKGKEGACGADKAKMKAKEGACGGMR